MHIFRYLQKYLIWFKLRLWLGHSRTFTELSISHSCCVLRFIVLLEGKPSAQSEVLNALDWGVAGYCMMIEIAQMALKVLYVGF